MHWSTDLLEWIWRSLARRLPVVAVGPELSANYRRAPAAARSGRFARARRRARAPPRARDYDAGLYVLSVGRLDQEKNPLLLADVLAVLHRHDHRWRLRSVGKAI